MNLNFLPTLVWLTVLTAGVALLVEANENRRGDTRWFVQVVLGAVLVLAFVANAWAGFAHWAECEDSPRSCEEQENE